MIIIIILTSAVRGAWDLRVKWGLVKISIGPSLQTDRSPETSVNGSHQVWVHQRRCWEDDGSRWCVHTCVEHLQGYPEYPSTQHQEDGQHLRVAGGLWNIVSRKWQTDGTKRSVIISAQAGAQGVCKTAYAIFEDEKAEQIHVTKTRDLNQCQEGFIKDMGLAYTERCVKCQQVAADSPYFIYAFMKRNMLDNNTTFTFTGHEEPERINSIRLHLKVTRWKCPDHAGEGQWGDPARTFKRDQWSRGDADQVGPHPTDQHLTVMEVWIFFCITLKASLFLHWDPEDSNRWQLSLRR